MKINRFGITLVLLMVATTAVAATPMAVIQAPIDTVITILTDPKYADAQTKEAQRDEIWKVVEPMFDFAEISKRAVARHWQKFSDGEKQEFTDVFAQFLGNTYIDKIQGEYQNEQVVYLEETYHQERYAQVKTLIVRGAVETPVNYRMIKSQSDQWKVYDIIVEGVSLVKNYRTQFASILQKETPAQLIQRLQDKLAEQKKRLADTR
jgi:phospholipid transport system substrate-binding protein